MGSMPKAAPPWLGKTDDLSDTERYRAMTPDERLECFVQVCELAHTILAEHFELTEQRSPRLRAQRR